MPAAFDTAKEMRAVGSERSVGELIALGRKALRPLTAYTHLQSFREVFRAVCIF